MKLAANVEVNGRYSESREALIVVCPSCLVEHVLVCKIFGAKQWLGPFVCDCNTEFKIAGYTEGLPRLKKGEKIFVSEDSIEPTERYVEHQINSLEQCSTKKGLRRRVEEIFQDGHTTGMTCEEKLNKEVLNR